MTVAPSSHYPRQVLRLIVFAAVSFLALKALVWWLEPRMAFFPFKGVQETPASVGVPFADHKIPTSTLR